MRFDEIHADDGNLAALRRREREEEEWENAPAVGICEVCGEPIRKTTYEFEGDSYVEIEGGGDDTLR